MADCFFLQEEERGSGIRAWFKVLLYEGSLVPPDSGEPRPAYFASLCLHLHISK